MITEANRIILEIKSSLHEKEEIPLDLPRIVGEDESPVVVLELSETLCK